MGALRFILASTVVLGHLFNVPHIGHMSVFFFFVLSGYLMTFVMQRSYGYSISGWKAFWVNRILRLYPTYLIVVALSVVVLSVIPKDVSSVFRGPLFLPETAWDWLQNITMIYLNPFPNEVAPRVSPATWALTTELFFYLMVSLGVSTTRTRTWVWFGASLAYVLIMGALGMPYAWFYFCIAAGSLPFAVGALLYHYKDKMCDLAEGRELALLFGGMGAGLGMWLVRKYAPGMSSGAAGGLILNTTVVFAALSIMALMSRPTLLLPKRMDDLLGAMAYPVYVIHWIIGLSVGYALGVPRPQFSDQGAVLFVLAYVITVILSAVLVKAVDPLFERLRDNVRSRATAA